MLNFLSKADKLLDIAFRWGALLTALAAAYAWLASKMPSLGKLNWAELVGIGVLSALTTLLFVAAALALFRIFRPLNIPVAENTADGRAKENRGQSSVSEAQIAELRRQVAELDHAVSQCKERADITEKLAIAARDVLVAEAPIATIEREMVYHKRSFDYEAHRLLNPGSYGGRPKYMEPQILPQLIEPFDDARWAKDFNPHKNVPGDEVYTDDATKLEYRRMAFKFADMQAKANAVIAKLREAPKAASQILYESFRKNPSDGVNPWHRRF